MEENIFTLWSIAHFASGIAIAFILSTKKLKLMEYIGIAALIPIFFITNLAVKIVFSVILAMACIAWLIDYFSKKGKSLKNYYKIIIALILLIGWEVFEYFTSSFTGFGIETITNRLADIIIGFMGFSLAYAFLNRKAKKELKKKFKNFSYHQ